MASTMNRPIASARISALVLLGLALATGPIALGQSAVVDAGAKLSEFEVVSIKPIDTSPGATHETGAQLFPDRFVMDAATLKDLICIAFNLSSWQVSGGEPWMDRSLMDPRGHFYVEAKLPQGLAPFDMRHTDLEIRDERIRQMMQAMLADRFHLKFHRETKTGTVSILERSGKPLLLVPSKMDGPEADIGASGGGSWGLDNTSMPQLAMFLSQNILHHTVIDKTSLDGSYDFKSATTVTNEDIRGGDDTSMFLPAVNEMGLKLTQTKGPVETFVIDHAERPSPN